MRCPALFKHRIEPLSAGSARTDERAEALHTADLRGDSVDARRVVGVTVTLPVLRAPDLLEEAPCATSLVSLGPVGAHLMPSL